MKKELFRIYLPAIIAMFFFSSCLKDQCTHTYSFYTPEYRTADEVRANIKSNDPVPVTKAGKLYLRGNYIFLNEPDRGIHVFDNSNPYSPKNVAFIDIPGNIDLAVKGNYLYADAYTDLVVIDITNPLDVKLKNVKEGVFPQRFYSTFFAQDSSRVIVNWKRRDTTVVATCGNDGFFGINPMKTDVLVLNSGCPNCANADFSNGNSSPNSPYGMGGSMARFTLMNNNLYTVSNSHLNVFNISNAEDPNFKKDIMLGWDVETIYPFKDKLFIGSMSGMFIYSVSNPDEPQQLGTFSHARSCDPVVADDDFAYVTLRSGTECLGFINQLDVLDIKDIMQPSLLKTYPLTNPRGLSKDGNYLLICDGDDGLKIFNATDRNNLELLSTISLKDTYDVIAWRGVALVVAQDGLYQYEYSDPSAPKLISKISL
ncbi:hypothetical protein [Pollutibacter soli]|uniref:LVIVD repeat-containing protein n=1 Tax=Pollutibacter soli TaxID=3034157 RepID=UPI003013EB06